MRLVLLNLLLALVWMFLHARPGLVPFLTGYALGYALLWLFAPVLREADYLRRTAALLRFLLIFLREFIVANIQVLRLVAFAPRASLQPGFVLYDVSELRPFETLLLSHCITLTPGTVSADLSGDARTLVVHALDASDPGRVRRGIDRNLRGPLLAFTR